MRSCPELQSLEHYVRVDVCIAHLDGDQQRVERILRREPRKACHVCDGSHPLRACPWLQGMPDEQKAALMSAYRSLKMREKDKLLRQWVDARRCLGLPMSLQQPPTSRPTGAFAQSSYEIAGMSAAVMPCSSI